jgi:hypothetical protein
MSKYRFAACLRVAHEDLACSARHACMFVQPTVTMSCFSLCGNADLSVQDPFNYSIRIYFHMKFACCSRKPCLRFHFSVIGLAATCAAFPSLKACSRHVGVPQHWDHQIVLIIHAFSFAGTHAPNNCVYIPKFMPFRFWSFGRLRLTIVWNFG